MLLIFVLDAQQFSRGIFNVGIGLDMQYIVSCLLRNMFSCCVLLDHSLSKKLANPHTPRIYFVA